MRSLSLRRLDVLGLFPMMAACALAHGGSDAASDAGIIDASGRDGARGAEAGVADGWAGDASAPRCRPLSATFVAAGIALQPRVAYDGTGYGVVWIDGETPTLYYAWFDRSLARRSDLVALGRVVTASAGLATIHFADGSFTISHADPSGGILLRRVDREGAMLSDAMRVTWHRGEHAVLPLASGDLVVSSDDAVPRDTRRTWATVTDREGRVMSEAPIVDGAGLPQAVATRAGVAVVTGGTDDAVQFVQLDPDGARASDATRLCCGESGFGGISFGPAVAGGSEGAIVFYADSTMPSRPIERARFDELGVFRDRAPVTTPAWTQGIVAARSPRGEIGVAWRDDRTGSVSTYFARFDSHGERLDMDRHVAGGEFLGRDDTLDMVATDTGFVIVQSARVGRDDAIGLSLSHVCPDGS